MRTHAIEGGDTLSALALRYYGDAGADPRLTEATGCPPEIVKREWSRGRTMSIEEAVRYALAGEG